MSLSSYTDFLNDGNRFNCAVIETDKSKIEQEGIIIGLIGPRFEKPNYMEWQDIIISPQQNTAKNGYGFTSEPFDKFTAYRHMWNKFYEQNDFIYENIKTSDNDRFINNGSAILDKEALIKRYAISFDTLLLEAQSRALKSNKKAFIHVVGIGLGVWQYTPNQHEIFMQAFEQRLIALGNLLTHVAVIFFSWFPFDRCGQLENGGFLKIDSHPDKGFSIFISKRNPSAKLVRFTLSKKFQNNIYFFNTLGKRI